MTRFTATLQSEHATEISHSRTSRVSLADFSLTGEGAELGASWCPSYDLAITSIGDSASIAKLVTAGCRDSYSLLERYVPAIYVLNHIASVRVVPSARVTQLRERAHASHTTDDAGVNSESLRQFLEQIYAQCDADDPDTALDLLFDEVDALLDHGEFERCDRLLDAVDLDRLDVPTMLGFLSTTVVAKRSLARRDQYFERVRMALLQKRSEADAAALLKGLE